MQCKERNYTERRTTFCCRIDVKHREVDLKSAAHGERILWNLARQLPLPDHSRNR
jgi:hypothetical protein